MSLLSYIKRILKPLMPKKYPKEFDYPTLPWIDKDESDIDAFLKNFKQKDSLPYDLGEKLKFWKKNGYVIFEKAIQHDLIDTYLSDIEELINNHSKYEVLVRLDKPEFSDNPIRQVKDVSIDVLRGKSVKVMDFHNPSVAGKKLMLHPNIIGFLAAVFDEKPIAMQSLTFLYGSQQDTHQDFAYVVSQVPSHLAASWIALEDVHENSGPLYYYEGSHKVKKFDFGNGIFFNKESAKNPVDFGNYLDKACESLGLKKKTLLINKGDVLIWHASLVHGGEDIKKPELTRKSYVSHYSSGQAYKFHRTRLGEEPVRQEMNGAEVFADPLFLQNENTFKAGEKF
jgi:phytanoyl-CoA hydroxylase